MNVREFIQKFMIEDIGKLVDSHPYHSFLLISIGIEFLGKCLNGNEWDDPNNSTNDFNNAIKDLRSFAKYRSITELHDKLRCGLAHLNAPKKGILLDKDGNDLSASPVILGCRELYEDFKSACNEVLEDKEGKVKKDMNKEYIIVDSTTGSTVTSYKEKK